MPEYISREAAIARLNENWKRTNTGSIAEACYSAAIESIHLIPAADVVEVVRCRECYFRELDGADIPVCTGAMAYSYTSDDWFCADGKHKDGGQDDG